MPPINAEIQSAKRACKTLAQGSGESARSPDRPCLSRPTPWRQDCCDYRAEAASSSAWFHVAFTSHRAEGDSNVTTKADNFVELSERDKQRMACLYEEVQGRLKEMSLIVARTLNQKVSERTHVMLRPIALKANN